MEKSEINQAMNENRAVKVDGHDGVFAIVEIRRSTWRNMDWS